MSKRFARKQDRKSRRKKAKSWCQIYVLRERADSPVRYVGQTRQSPDMRLWWHLKDLKRTKEQRKRLTPVKSWLDGLSNPPVIEVIDLDGIWDITEAVWIDRLIARGEPLLNLASVVRKAEGTLP